MEDKNNGRHKNQPTRQILHASNEQNSDNAQFSCMMFHKSVAEFGYGNRIRLDCSKHCSIFTQAI